MTESDRSQAPKTAIFADLFQKKRVIFLMIFVVWWFGTPDDIKRDAWGLFSPGYDPHHGQTIEVAQQIEKLRYEAKAEVSAAKNLSMLNAEKIQDVRRTQQSIIDTMNGNTKEIMDLIKQKVKGPNP